jgi:uncharacterized protein YndB with AHSA1/START domain
MAGKSSGKLQVTRTSDTEIVLARVFDAPRHLVWEAMTKPEYVRHWWCCMDGFTMPVCEIDLRVGGKWHYVMVGPDGTEVGFYGEYREIAPPDRLVSTEIFAPYPDSPAVVTVTLEERGGKTHYRGHVQHDSKISCDMHLASGMEGGANIAFDRLDAVAGSLTNVVAAGSSGAVVLRDT